jgi:hypothetical protein
MAEDVTREEIDRFVLAEIDTVPHLECLLLLWRSRPRQWPLGEIGAALFISDEATRAILRDLQRRQLVSALSDERFSYHPAGHDRLVQGLERTYRVELVRISNMIHSKPSAALREFARAFRMKKEPE